jgi:hypothetical protein
VKYRYKNLAPDLSPLRKFANEENVHPVTVTQIWALYGQAPELTRIGRRVFVSDGAWRGWLRRREADRIRSGKPWLRAPLPTTPRPKRTGEGL